MNRIHTILAATLVLLFAAGATIAQDAKKLSLADTVTIRSVDTEKSLIRGTDADGKTVVVGFDSDTSFVKGSEAFQVADLNSGDRVVVEARKEMEGAHDGDELIADRVLLVVDPATR